MKLNNDVAEWINKRPNWQKNAFKYFCAGGTPEDLDYKTIADQLITETGTVSDIIKAEQIPGSTNPNEQVALSSVSNLKGINALIQGQILDFALSGLTIVFGNNGCGKSGYARLLKESVTARADPGEILGNAFIEKQPKQEATIQFQVNGSEGSQPLFSTETTPLSRIRFYDETCGDLYVKKASTTSYQPPVLKLLDHMTTACELLSTEISNRIDENDQAKSDLPKAHEGTFATEFLSSLSYNTSKESIDAYSVLPADHEKKTADLLAEVARLNGTSPVQEKERLVKLSKNWTTLADHAKTLSDSLSNSSIKILTDLEAKTRSLREAARLASLKSFEDEPLAGVGSDAWRALWEAARQFSLNEAYENHQYPVTTPGSLCVLCQQPLTEAATHRLHTFEAYIKNFTERNAEQHEDEVRRNKAKFSKLQILPKPVEQALREINSEGSQVDETIAWFDSAVLLAKDILNWLDDTQAATPNPLTSDAHTQFRRKAQQYKKSADKISVQSFNDTLGIVSKQLHELQDMKALSESYDDLAAEVQRLGNRQKLVEARKLTATNAITKKRSEIVEDHVTKDVSAQFSNEVEYFGLENVVLSRSGRGKSTALDHQPELVGSATKIQLEQVLSEGEQTVLGLAGFLTEVEFDESHSGVCFDDPVSSLDAERRFKVAERLADLAKTRQVVVFTHEITFVHALAQSAEWRRVSVLNRTIQRGAGRTPGLITKGFPWQAKTVKERFQVLKNDLESIKNKRATMSDSEYSDCVGKFAGRLSTTLERSVSHNIVNQLMDRGSNQVHTKMLKILPRFTQEDAIEFDRMYSLVSGWATRHDNATEENYTPPDLETLGDAFQSFENWDKRVRNYSS